MANAKQIKDTIIVCTEIARKLLLPDFKFSKGGATLRTLGNFIDLISKEFGAVTPERLVDVLISSAYAFKSRPEAYKTQAFGPAAIKRYAEQKRGILFYQNEWLESGNLSRAKLLAMIQDRSVHPLSKYIFMQSEEGTKMRHLNEEVGYLVCQLSTMGWSPVSAACSECGRSESCKKETAGKYPELYRIREEYGKSIEQRTD